MLESLSGPAADFSTRDFNEAIADPDVFCGGGSVAALSGASAGATALLVMRLNARRKANADQRQRIDTAIALTEELVEACYRAADDDIRILSELLEAQRALKSSPDRDVYRSTLMRAAESPIAVADRIAAFLPIIQDQLDLSSRFTASDLGAAAVLAAGACRAALLTAEVNIVLLSEDPEADQQAVERIAHRCGELRQRAVSLADDIERQTRERIEGRRPAQA
jgi:methenyltetrahydrofolate cyclohydrolase